MCGVLNIKLLRNLKPGDYFQVTKNTPVHQVLLHNEYCQEIAYYANVPNGYVCINLDNYELEVIDGNLEVIQNLLTRVDKDTNEPYFCGA